MAMSFSASKKLLSAPGTVGLLARGKHATSRLSFDDYRAAFQHKTTWELYRALIVLRACSSDLLVDNSLKIMQTGRRVLGTTLIDSLLRPTVYAQFVAGQDEKALARVASKLRDQELRLMIAPTLEEDIGEAGSSQGKYERNLIELLRLADMAAEHGGTQPCLQVKVTALISADVLRNLSSAVPSPTVQSVEILAEAIAGRNTQVSLPGVSREDLEQIALSVNHFATLGKAATDKGIRLLVDAEWSYVNPGCSLYSLAMMAVFNQHKPIVANTFQCYFKGALGNLTHEIDVSKKLGACFAAKLVRGAYLEREREVDVGTTCSSHAATGENYNRVLDHALAHAADTPQRSLLFVATHNEGAVYYATESLDKLGIDPRTGNVRFAQIYGMAEQISMPLARSGYLVYKSVPMGRVEQVLPYLSRRAAENRSVLKGARKERELLQKELMWRLKNYGR